MSGRSGFRVALLGALVDAHRSDGLPPTMAQLSATVGADISTVRRHLTALVRDGLVDVDRRTPLRVQLSPLQEWAARVVLPSPTARPLLQVMAAHANAYGCLWCTTPRLSELSGLPPRTVKRHVAALVACGRVERTREYSRPEAGGPAVRGANGYRLMAGPDVAPPPPVPAPVDYAERVVLPALPWWHAWSPADQAWAVRRVASYLAAGWPPDVLIQRLTIRPQEDGQILDPRKTLANRIRKLPRVYVPSAVEEIGLPAARLKECITPGCGEAFPDHPSGRCPRCRCEVCDAPTERADTGRGRCEAHSAPEPAPAPVVPLRVPRPPRRHRWEMAPAAAGWPPPMAEGAPF